ncbi:MAG: redoxin domain-containing protein, partial [Bdellovibrionota bacterium]
PDGWQLGNPDQLLASSAPYTIEPSGDDDYRCFVLPYTADLDRWVTGYEIQPDKASVVHHVILYLDYLGESAKLDHQDGKPGYTCFGGPGVSRAGVLGGWAPGTVARFAPPGIGTPVPAGAKMVMQVHYHHDGKLEMDQTRVGLHFAAQKPEHNLEIWGVLNKEFKIPAGNAAYSVGAELELPFNVHVVNIFPHMHLLGKDMRVEAITPDGANRCMVHVPDWDFDWQGFYEYKDFIALPKGTKIRLTATYDNSELNPNQFNHPPKDVSYGEKTTDEMALAFFSIIRD